MAAWWAEAEAARPRGDRALRRAERPARRPAVDAAPPARGARGGRRQRLRGRPPAGAAAARRRRRGAAPGRWRWSMPRSTPPRPRPSSAAGSSPRWSPPATPTSPTRSIPAISPACSDRVVVLTKGALEVHSARGDRRSRPAQHRGDRQLGRHAARGRQGRGATDGSMTLSHRQTTDFARALPRPAGLPRHPPRQRANPPLDPAHGPAAHRLFRLPAQHPLPGEPRRDDRPRRHRHRPGGDELARRAPRTTTATGSCAGGARRTTAGSRSSRASSPPAATPW